MFVELSRELHFPLYPANKAGKRGGRNSIIICLERAAE